MEESNGGSGSGSGGCRYDLRSKTNKNSSPQDLESSPAPERAKEVEEVSEKKDADYVARYRKVEYDTNRLAPQRKEPSEKRKAAWKKKQHLIVDMSLKFFNKSKKAKKVGEYEVVEMMGVTMFSFGMKGYWYHAGFKAKPKNSLEAEPKTFFAELKRRHQERDCKCVKCCLLGPLDHGYHGCYCCKRSGLTIHHPLSGFRNGYPQHTL